MKTLTKLTNAVRSITEPCEWCNGERFYGFDECERCEGRGWINKDPKELQLREIITALNCRGYGIEFGSKGFIYDFDCLDISWEYEDGSEESVKIPTDKDPKYYEEGTLQALLDLFE